MPTELSIFLIISAALTVQALAGFGSALIAMPLLVQLLSLTVAAPVFALLAVVAETILIIRHRAAFRFSAMWRLIAAHVVGVPVGIIGAGLVPEHVMRFILGVVVIGYALYSLFAPQLRRIEDPRWGYGFGLIAGTLSGAYNTGGPPHVIYGTNQGWPPAEFKGNLQSVFLVSSVAVIIGHTLTGRVTGEVLGYVAVGLPGVLLAMLLGFRLERRVSPAAFRRGVLALLLLIGLTLIF